MGITILFAEAFYERQVAVDHDSKDEAGHTAVAPEVLEYGCDLGKSGFEFGAPAGIGEAWDRGAVGGGGCEGEEGESRKSGVACFRNCNASGYPGRTRGRPGQAKVCHTLLGGGRRSGAGRRRRAGLVVLLVFLHRGGVS